MPGIDSGYDWLIQVRLVVQCEYEGGTFMNNSGGRSAGVGVWGFGSMLAITLSWSVHRSILWMILHGIFSWFYVAYYAWLR